MGVKRFYSALIQANNFKIVDQTKGYPGINFGGTGSSHGDITQIIPQDILYLPDKKNK
ncbi:MAG: hypothetical protein R3A12_07100 [Ignavibacteria bacterium]